MTKDFFEILQDVRSVLKFCRNFILKKWLFKSSTSLSQPDDLQHLSILGRLWVTWCFLTFRILNMIKFESSSSLLLLGWKSANSKCFNPNKRKRMLFYGNMFLSRTVSAVTLYSISLKECAYLSFASLSYKNYHVLMGF